MYEPTTIAAIGAAGVAAWIGWPTIQAALSKLFKDGVVIETTGESLHDCVTQLRYYIAVQGPELREEGQKALDVVQGIVSQQPLLPPPPEGRIIG